MNKKVCDIARTFSTAPDPYLPLAYWISSLWCTQAKRYYESLELPLIAQQTVTTPSNSGCVTPTTVKKLSTKKKGCSSRTKKNNTGNIKQLALSSDMNRDIVCDHGGLALSKAPGCRRRLIDKRSWSILRRFHRGGSEFKCSDSIECIICSKVCEDGRVALEEQKEAELASRRQAYLPNSLTGLIMRKNGVPSEYTINRWLALSEQEIENEEMFIQAVQSLGLSANRPLVPGMYNLVPRSWLRIYRRYLKDPEVLAIPPVDCTKLLCYAHGLLVVPPHLEDYLIGVRRSLLNNLLEYPGEIVEIVTLEEWEAIQRLFRADSDFHVRFCVDSDDITWNMGLCKACDPFNYGASSGTVGMNRSRSRVTVL